MVEWIDSASPVEVIVRYEFHVRVLESCVVSHHLVGVFLDPGSTRKAGWDLWVHRRAFIAGGLQVIVSLLAHGLGQRHQIFLFRKDTTECPSRQLETE